MATRAIEVLGPLAFVVVLELARLARDIPLVGYGGETERVDYGTDPGRVVGFVSALATRLSYSGRLVSVGGFHVVFTLTEVVLFGSILLVYATSAPLLDTGIEGEGTPIGVIVFLGLVWVLLPVIVVDRYDDLARQGIRPFSIDVHVATTLLYLLAIVVAIEGKAVFIGATDFLGAYGVRRTDRVQGLLGAFVGTSGAYLVAKARLYRRYLRTELDRLESPPGDDG